MTRINRAGINKHMSYNIKQLSDILHKNEKTCLRWIDAGLPVVEEGKKPILIMGSALTVFLRNKDAKKKFKLKRNEFYCLRCKVPRHAKRGSVETLSDRKVGICSVCSGKVTRIIKPYQKGLFDTPP